MPPAADEGARDAEADAPARAGDQRPICPRGPDSSFLVPPPLARTAAQQLGPQLRRTPGCRAVPAAARRPSRSVTSISATTRAGRREKTMTRSARNTASSTSWVTKMMVLASRCWMRAKLDLQLFAPLGIERAERLVHQQHVGAGGQRPGDGDALAHAAGDLVRIGVGEIVQADQVQIVVAARRASRRRRGRCGSACRRRRSRRPSARERTSRTGRPCRAAGRACRPARHPGRSPPEDGVVQPADHAHQRGLAAARRAEEDDEFVALDRRG